MFIRQEKKSDYNEIAKLVKESFQASSAATGDEPEYISALRRTRHYVPELALVMEKRGDLIGYIMATETMINCGKYWRKSLLISPLCVRREQRSQSYGTDLVLEVIRRATIMGYDSVFAVGEPAYYKRLGFRPASFYNIVNTENIPDEHTLVRPLRFDTLHQTSGVVSCK